MITGAHFLFYSRDPEADRAFFRDILGFAAVDAGEGWLIFAMPAAEAGIHPLEGTFPQKHDDQDLLGAVLYLMCDDLKSTIAALKAKKVDFTPIQSAGWGTVTTFTLPSGGHIGLYQPRHETALHLSSKQT